MWMYMGNLSLRTFFNLFFFIRKFSNFRICSNLVGFNRINSIEFLLNVQNQLSYLRLSHYTRGIFLKKDPVQKCTKMLMCPCSRHP